MREATRAEAIGSRRVPSPRPAPRRAWGRLLAMGSVAVVALLLVGTWAAGHVVLSYTDLSKASSASSPFRFVNGVDYAAEHTQGFATITYSSVQQLSATLSTQAFDGASGSYQLDSVELSSLATTAMTWHLGLRVITPLAGKGVNAAFVSYCTARPTTVPDTGAALSSGTDANGNPWALYAPTCGAPAVEASLSLLAVGQGATLTVVGLTNGVSVLYLSFLFAVTNTGATTTTPASVGVIASTP